MLITEWNWDTAKEVWEEEAREKGHEKGFQQGLAAGLEQGLEQGMEKERQRFLDLLNQGLSTEEIKRQI